eukprot:8070140-Pyramimonas_sp.AAC.1
MSVDASTSRTAGRTARWGAFQGAPTSRSPRGPGRMGMAKASKQTQAATPATCTWPRRTTNHWMRLRQH